MIGNAKDILEQTIRCRELVLILALNQADNIQTPASKIGAVGINHRNITICIQQNGASIHLGLGHGAVQVQAADNRVRTAVTIAAVVPDHDLGDTAARAIIRISGRRNHIAIGQQTQGNIRVPVCT